MGTRKAGKRTPKASDSSKSAPARYLIENRSGGRVAEPRAAYSSASVVSATDAARRFSDLINRAAYQGETFVVERGGRQICQIGPLEPRVCTGADLLALLARLPRPDEDFLAAVESANLHQAEVDSSPWDK